MRNFYAPARGWIRLPCVVPMLGLAVILAAACTPVPLDRPKPQSFAFAANGQSDLQRVVSTLEPLREIGHSTVIPVASGNAALGARLRVINQAQHAIDMQYFLMKPDLAGSLVMEALLQAADRGVRVRLLLDDIFTPVRDHALSLFAAHPNVNVRIFNPALRPGPKSLGMLAEFKRVNRRMHNKTFTVDGALAIVGGRNIADEYYQIQTSSQFADFEVILTGPVVKEVASAFDLYWNDGWAVPIGQLHDTPSQKEVRKARAALEKRLASARDEYRKAVEDHHFERLLSGQEPIFHGPVEVVVDTPDKLRHPVRGGTRILAEELLGRMLRAKREVVLITPYFVPEDYGARLLTDLAARGVKVRIITNSLGSTNHAYVHAGYRRHRADLLRAGVELYEIRHDALQASGELPPEDTTGLVMHTKLAVIDEQHVFVGSLNFDPRSIKLNTEFGVFIRDRDLAQTITEGAERQLSRHAYRLAISDEDQVLWHYDHPDARSVTSKEPDRTVFNALIIGITSLLGVELQL